MNYWFWTETHWEPFPLLARNTRVMIHALGSLLHRPKLNKPSSTPLLGQAEKRSLAYQAIPSISPVHRDDYTYMPTRYVGGLATDPRVGLGGRTAGSMAGPLGHSHRSIKSTDILFFKTCMKLFVFPRSSTYVSSPRQLALD